MTSHERWQRVQELFEVLEPLPAVDRQVEISRLDPELAREMTALFQALEQEEAAQQELQQSRAPVPQKPELEGIRLLRWYRSNTSVRNRP